MAQDYSFCPTTPDQVLPGVLGALPQGPAWDAAAIPGTTMYKFWRAISGVIGGIVADLCAFRLELYCSTATKSLDQWDAEYGIGAGADPCDAFADQLCAKVITEGGQTCGFFTETLATLGYAVTCHDLYPLNDTLGICGCAVSGCGSLGFTSVPTTETSCLAPCNYGPAIAHPVPAVWPVGSDRSGVLCTVPGSLLGLGGDCCNFAGYFDLPAGIAPGATPLGAVCDDGTVYSFDVPASTSTLPPECSPTDSSGLFLRYTGYTYLWGVTIAALPGQPALTAAQVETAYCTLATIQPAHVTVVPGAAL